MSNSAARIYILLASFKGGGTERTASRIGTELLRRGYQVKFLLINPVFDYRDENLVRNSVILGNASRWRLFRILRAYLRLLSIVWTERPSALVSFSLGLNILAFFVFYPGTVLRIEANIFILRKRPYRRYLQRVFSWFPHVSKIVVPSTGLYEACRAYFGRMSYKLVQVNNPLDIDEIKTLRSESLADFPELEDTRFIVSAGRLNTGKGFEQLIEIFPQSIFFKKTKLVILGKGPLYDELRQMVIDNHLEADVVLGGYQQNPYRFFSRSKFLVLNSSHESFGNVLIEAMACGVPVISNDCDYGPRHIITHRSNGLLYDRLEGNQFLESINSMADADLYEKLKTGAIASVALYRVQDITDDWISRVFNWSRIHHG